MNKLLTKRNKNDIIKPDYLAAENLRTIKIDRSKELNELIHKVSEHSFISTSPITGEMVDAVRTDDVIDILKAYFNPEEE
jgi:hypothetical protein